MTMQHVRVLVYVLSALSLSLENIQGKSLGANKELSQINRDTIADLSTDLRNVLNFLESLSEGNSKAGKHNQGGSRSGIAYNVWHMKSSSSSLNRARQRDESVVKAKADEAAQAVKASLAATLQTQEGVEKISQGLHTLQKCLKKFENTISV